VLFLINWIAMNESNSVGGEEMKMAAYGALSVLKDNLPASFKISEKFEDDFVISALKRHGNHLSVHTISQDHVDPLKLICWLGCAIISEIKDDTFQIQSDVLTAIINSLEETIMLETNCQISLSENDRNLYHRLAIEEIKGNGDHGIGFNGLFIGFHSLRASYNALVKE